MEITKGIIYFSFTIFKIYFRNIYLNFIADGKIKKNSHTILNLFDTFLNLSICFLDIKIRICNKRVHLIELRT